MVTVNGGGFEGTAGLGGILMNAQAAPVPVPDAWPSPQAPEAPRPIIPEPANDNRPPRPPNSPVFRGFARALGAAGLYWSAAELLGPVNDRAAQDHVQVAADRFGLDLSDPHQASAAHAYAWAKGPESALPSWMNRTGIDLPKSGEASDRAARAVMDLELANPGITAAVIAKDGDALRTMQYAVDLVVDGPTATLPTEWSDVDRQSYHAQRAAGASHSQAAAGVENDIAARLEASDGVGSEGVAPFNTADKLNRYLLDKTHADGGPKAEWFEQALGFNRDNLPALADQIRFVKDDAVVYGQNEHGTLYNQFIEIEGANGRKIEVRFSFIELNDGRVGLVTAKPTDKP